MQPDISPVDSTIAAFQATRADDRTIAFAMQEDTEKNFQTELTEEMPYIAMLHKKQKPLKAARPVQVKKTEATEKKTDTVKDAATKFSKKNPELKFSSLIGLRERIKQDSSQEEILETLKEFYPDPSLADEALDFLLETADGELAETLQKAKEEFSTKNSREISAGKNISTQAREASADGKGTLGTASDLRDLYRNITGNPRDSNTLFDELSNKYAFADLKKVTNFLFHSLGADLKSKGPSIPPGQLHVLMAETRSLQAILNVYRFFNMRMNLVNKLFKKAGLTVPSKLNFETLSKQFMGLVSDRYPTSDKVLQTAVRLGIEKWIMAKIIAFSQLRDAIREMAVNQIYRSIQHRDELYMAILEALEDLEDELEELMDQDSDEDDDDHEAADHDENQNEAGKVGG